MSKFIMGRYVPGKSLVHRMNPVSKICLCFYFILITLLSNNWLAYLLLSVLLLGSVLASEISLLNLYKGIRPLIIIILITGVLQMIFSSQGTVLWKWGPLFITKYGISNGIFIMVRFILIVIISTVLTLSTSPISIANGIEIILSPLKYFKVPVNLISLMISIALRFIPTLMDQLSLIVKAQRSRGVDFNKGSCIKRIEKYTSLLIPLLFNSFERAQILSMAMISRGYQNNHKRSHYHVYKWRYLDVLSWIVYLGIGMIWLLIRK